MQLKLAAFRLSAARLRGRDRARRRSRRSTLRAQTRADVIVSDVMMPELDGFGLAMAVRQDPELRERAARARDVELRRAEDRELARRAGANELVVAHARARELIDMLRDDARAAPGAHRRSTPSRSPSSSASATAG